MVLELAQGSCVAGSFTRNAFCAAPVTLARQYLEQAPCSVRYLLINTGNANAGTGARGLADARLCCAELARHAGVDAQSVLPFSTGVIGEPLPTGPLIDGIPAALAALDENSWQAAAEGIMTTDTRPKGASRRVVCDGHQLTLSGIAKGAGMIRPDMATMLAFVATDARVSASVLDEMLARAVADSFNCITVDGDTSTNDACMLIATGRSEAPGFDDIDDPRVPAAERGAARSVHRACAGHHPRCRRRHQVRYGAGARGARRGRMQARGLRGRRIAIGQDRIVRQRPQLGAHPGGGWTCRCRGARRDAGRHPPQRNRHRARWRA